VSGNVNFRYLNSPSSVLVDPVYKRVIVADDQASRVQVFDMNGAYLTTLGGEWGEAGGRMRDPSGLAVDSNGDLFVADRENARVQVYLPYETFWTQLNVNGFGEQFNGRVDGLAYFTVPYKGSPTSMLYVTTVRDDGNPPTPGAAASSPQVWRMLPDYTWQAVSAPGFGDSANTALVDLAAYNSDLYAGTFNVSGAQIWRCHNTNPATPTNPCAQQSDWTQVTMPWGQPSSQFSIADRMVEFKPDGNTDLLAVSMMNYYSSSGVYTTSGGEVWLYNGSTDAWLNYPLTLDATHAGTALVGVQSMTAFNGTLVAGTNDWVHSPPVPAQLWVCTWTSGNCAWGSSPKRDFSSINTNVTAITSLLVVGTNLYVGTTGANNTGASIYCYFNAWSDSMTIMTGGFGDPNNSAINAMAYQSSSLFAVTSNAQTGLNIYSSNNGLNWGAYLEYPGFGNATNTQVDLDSSVTFDPSGRMLVGTWNTANGGALWASKVSHYQISGVVTTPGNPPTGLDGVKMTLQPGNLQQTTSGGGNYTFSNLLPGSYTITPSLAAYAFTPPNQVVNLTNASVSNINFSGASGAITLQAPANGTQFASLDPVTLQWVSNGAATKYTLEVSTALSFTPLFKNVTVTGLTYALSGLKSNTTYYWQVRQAVPTPVGTWSAPWSFTTPVPPAAPVLLTPANGAALPAGDFIPIFTWKAAVVPAGSAPVQHYHIQASKQSTFTSLDIDEYTLDASTTFTTLFNLTGNRTYYWRVRAFNTVGD
jgi:hypothetical protein